MLVCVYKREEGLQLEGKGCNQVGDWGEGITCPLCFN